LVKQATYPVTEIDREAAFSPHGGYYSANRVGRQISHLEAGEQTSA